MGMIRIAAVAALIAAAGAASGQHAPDYYSAPDHAVTVRAAPGGQAIGALAPGAGPLEATGHDADGVWARIAFGEGDGWVAVDALVPVTPAPAPYADLPLGLACSGTEPFWSLRFDADAVTAQEPGGSTLALAPGATATAQGAGRYPLALSLDGLVAVVHPQTCSDGMSDRTHAWTIDLIMQRDGAVALRTGCCRLPTTP